MTVTLLIFPTLLPEQYSHQLHRTARSKELCLKSTQSKRLSSLLPFCSHCTCTPNICAGHFMLKMCKMTSFLHTLLLLTCSTRSQSQGSRCWYQPIVQHSIPPDLSPFHCRTKSMQRQCCSVLLLRSRQPRYLQPLQLLPCTRAPCLTPTL